MSEYKKLVKFGFGRIVYVVIRFRLRVTGGVLEVLDFFIWIPHSLERKQSQGFAGRNFPGLFRVIET